MPSSETSIAVVIPTLNRSLMLREAVISVLAQTRPANEIIVVDDGSNEDIEKALANLNGPIRIIRHSQNRGHSASRNTGIENAASNLIAFLDSDDLWHPNKLFIQTPYFESGARVGLVGGGYEYINEVGEVVASPTLPPLAPSYSDLAIGLFAFSGSSPLALCKKIALESTGGFDESLPLLEDWDMWIRISEHFEVRNPQHRLAQIRMHSEPRAHRPPGAEMIELTDRVRNELNNRIEDDKLKRRAQALTLFQKYEGYIAISKYRLAFEALYQSIMTWPLTIHERKPRIRSIAGRLTGKW